jgi:regulator of sigma E protease
MLDKVTGIAYLMLILSVLVVVHEWGHFAVAKWFKMRVEEFALFFGPRLVRLGRKGDTEYNIRSIPAGGFVRIAGMDPDDVSGGRPLLEAIRHPRYHESDPLGVAIEQLNNDTMAGINTQQVSQEVRLQLQQSIGANGQLTEEGRADLEMKQAAPEVNEDERKLIQMVLLADSRTTDPGLYSQKPIYQRALTIFAGPFMSLAFGYVLFCIMGMTIGLPNADKLTNQVQVLPEGNARAAGLKTGDRIVAIDNVPTPDGRALTEKINGSVDKPLILKVDRGGEMVTINVHTKAIERPKYDKKTYKPILDKKGNQVQETVGVIGIVPNAIFERHGVVESISAGTAMTEMYITNLLKLFTDGKKAKESVGGPIAMAQATTALQKLGLEHLVYMAAMLSLSLGIMNLLPIPVLDGGHLMLLLIEKIRRRKLTPKEVYRAQMVGLAMLGVLIVFVTYNDIARTLLGRGFQ